MMKTYKKNASGGQGIIPWTPGLEDGFPLVPRDKSYPNSAGPWGSWAVSFFGRIFSWLGPGRAVCAIALALVLQIIAPTLYAGEATQVPLTPAAPQQQSVGPAPMTDIHDIALPLFTGLSSGVKKAMLFGGIAAGVALLLLVGLWLWFRRKQGVKKAAEIIQPPDVLANMALDRIEPLMSRDGKAFYFELSEATKHYLKGRFGLDAPEMTAEELLPKLPDLPVTLEQKKCVSTLFTHAEPVKFAGVTPDHNAMVEDLSAIRCFVTETAAEEEVEEGHSKSVPPAARG